MRSYRDLIKHSSIYGVAQIVSRLASILLLPVYTHYLRPADYGVIAILDLLTGLLAIVIGSGMLTAVTRYHFDVQDSHSEFSQNSVWWSGLAFLVGAATVVVAPIWLARGILADLALGLKGGDGASLVAMAVWTLWFNCIGRLGDVYLRVRKWSGRSLALAVGRLAFNAGLNIYALAVLDLGVRGVLVGNLVTAVVFGFLQTGLLAVYERPFCVRWPLLKQLMAFGAPLVVTALLSVVLHQADRILLKIFVGLDGVGVYSLAYQIGQAVNSLCLLPFTAIWGVVIYEIAAQPDAKQTYSTVFEYFVYSMLLMMLAASLFAEPVLGLLAADDYAGAVRLVPVICLAYVFFSLHEHFRVPVMLAKRTLNLIPTFVVSAMVNILANVVLIPLFGIAGAAWASVVTFVTFSLVGLRIYRRIDQIPYPFFRCSLVLVAMTVTYVAVRGVTDWSHPVRSTLIVAAVWLAWAVYLFRRLLSDRLKSWGRLSGPAGKTVRTKLDPAAR